MITSDTAITVLCVIFNMERERATMIVNYWLEHNKHGIDAEKLVSLLMLAKGVATGYFYWDDDHVLVKDTAVEAGDYWPSWLKKA